MTTQTRLVFTTVPDSSLAEKLTNELIESGLAACVKTFPGCTSTYRWGSQVEQTKEIPLIIVVHTSCYNALQQHIKAMHPYDVPEILAIDCSDGLSDYLRWVASVAIR